MDTTLFKKLVNIPSVFPNEKNLSLFIKKWITTNVSGIKIQIQKVSETRENIMISKGDKQKSVLLVGHLDTIPVVSGWNTDPYLPIIKNDNLIGIGSWDMKAGLYIILQCLKKFIPENITLKIAFTVDEENFSIGAHELVKSDFVKNVQFILIPEPGFTYGHHGVTIGRTGRSTYILNFKGKSAHGSKSYEGINAILEAQKFIVEVQKLQFTKIKEFGQTTIFPSMIKSVAKGFSVPDECELELDCKLVCPDTPESVLNIIIEIGKKMFKKGLLIQRPTVKYKDRPTPFCTPYMLKKDNEYAKICSQVVKKITGKSKLFYRESVADECIYVEKLKVPAICIGPQGKNAHNANESVDLTSVRMVEKTYLQILNEVDKYLSKS